MVCPKNQFLRGDGVGNVRRWGRGQVFALSFAASLLVLGLMITLLLVRLCAPPAVSSTPAPAAANTPYLPSGSDRLTLLLVVEGGLTGSDTFALAGFYPDIGYLPVMVLPNRLGLQNTTLQQLYHTRGAAAASAALQQSFGIRVDRTAALPAESFARLVDRAGNVDFQLSAALHDPATGLDLPAGLHQFDGQKAQALLSCATWPQGEEQRCTVAGGLLAQLLNTHLPMVLLPRWEGFYKTLLNSCSFTDLNSVDHETYLPAARFLARLARSPGQALVLSGSTTPAGAFAPNAEGLALLHNTFGPVQQK